MAGNLIDVCRMGVERFKTEFLTKVKKATTHSKNQERQENHSGAAEPGSQKGGGPDPVCLQVPLATLTVVFQSERYIGAVATYRYNSGFLLISDAVRICLPDKTWNGTNPTCSRLCRRLGEPNNGAVTYSGDHRGTVGANTTYQYANGCQVSGDRIRTCQSDGSWSGSEPTCNESLRDIQRTIPVPTPDPVAGECRLGLLGSSAADPLDAGARFFGATNESRYEFESLGRDYALDDDMSFGLKTAAAFGVLYYIADQQEHEITTLYLEDGYLVYKYDYGSGPVVIRSDIQVNDNEWHQVRTKRRGPNGNIFVDDINVGNGVLTGGRPSRYLSVVTPLYVGGLPANLSVRVISPESRVSLIGCIKDFTVDPPRDLISEFEVRQCQGSREPGVFFGQYGGYLALNDRFSVGVNMEIALEIKPRRTTGMIFAFQTPRMNFMSLEMLAGELFLTIEKGGGEFTAVFSPLDGEYSLCDGEWHTVKVVKEGHEAYIEVDGVQGATVSGSPRSSEANTNNALYFGGLPNNIIQDVILENVNYVGCMKNVVINGVDKSISASRFVVDVDVRSCPAN